MSNEGKNLVVVSFYNARGNIDLNKLLYQMETIPSGCDYDVIIVVNDIKNENLKLWNDLDCVKVVYRKNIGYNIGAWNYAWATCPEYDKYLFLQDECIIVKNNWLKYFTDKLEDKKIGLVGEMWFSNETKSWSKQIAQFREKKPGRQNFFSFVRNFIIKKGIDPGGYVDHLQSLVLATRGSVLKQINGFPIGHDKNEAIASEVAISRAVFSLGFKCTLVGNRPFSVIMHPQWKNKARVQRRNLVISQLKMRTMNLFSKLCLYY